ncbi:NAD-dependent epimerase/dehydratase family protein [Cytobacillus spongiae]|jgi:nucleoside-diphosphate-sugar epimerase|uniref:NAD-dependent epimerase/dehydratase family protein n=1 Tax=Cytobacillus spongiae TaxID=2901381 RepID=UPI001F3D2C27|nr:NAD-dependent epimerase/dehydratase family protein [Cytobacillus spongiae]UII54412.1 NAD-dependent epimerase/dehydratase family protein [Cytobacillus spongiae]
MNNILVLGGTQFFGKRLVQRLIDEGKQVTIATRGKTSDPFGDHVQRLKIDRQDPASMLEQFKDKKWDIVFDQTCQSPKEAQDTIHALKDKVKRYIFTSTMAVYEFGTNHSEEDFDPHTIHPELKPRTAYQGYIGYREAKRGAEAVLFNEKNLEVVSVRFPIVIGKDDYTNRLHFHVKNILNDEEIGMKDPNARYSFILSNEAAGFLYEIGNSGYTGSINAGCKQDLSIVELIELIEEIVGKKATITDQLTEENTSPYALPGSWSLNTNKAIELGFTFTDVHQSIVELTRYYQTQE